MEQLIRALHLDNVGLIWSKGRCQAVVVTRTGSSVSPGAGWVWRHTEKRCLRLVGLALDYHVWEWAGLRTMLKKGEDVDSAADADRGLGTMLEVGDNGFDIRDQALMPSRGLY